MSGSGDFTREIGVHKPNLADMARHLESDDREKVAERTSGEYSEHTVSPEEYLAITEGYETENNSLIGKIMEGLSSDPIQQRRERAKELIEEEPNPENIGFGYTGELSQEEILETLEKYEDPNEDPYEVSLDDYMVFTAIKQKSWMPHHSSEEWQDKLSLKELPGLGTFEYIEGGACRTVYRGPVDGDNNQVIYIPDEISTPNAYENEFGNRMAQVAAAVQNKQNIEDLDIDAEFVSDQFEPVIVNLHGETVPVIVADYREMEDIPNEKGEQAYEAAEELQERSENGELIYHKTGTRWSNAEFIKGGGVRRDNIKHDPNTGELVVADAGEFNSKLSREDLEELLTEEMSDLLNNQIERVT